MRDGGLIGGGAGSVNFWTSRKSGRNGLTNWSRLLVGGLLRRQRRHRSGTRAR